MNNRLQCFGHIRNKVIINAVKQAWRVPLVGLRSRGRQRIRLRDMEVTKVTIIVQICCNKHIISVL